jgi:hypothetical protein
MKRAVVEFKSNDKMVETRFNLRSSLRWIGFLFLAFLVVTFPVLGQNHEITLSLGGIPSQSRNFQRPAEGSTQISSDVSIGGEPRRFRPLIELYREARRRAGHSPEQLTVGLHSVGFLADTTDEAAEIFFPGYAHTFTEIGNERGWPPATRAQFDAVRGPTGALLIGDAKRSRRRSFT